MWPFVSRPLTKLEILQNRFFRLDYLLSEGNIDQAIWQAQHNRILDDLKALEPDAVVIPSNRSYTDLTP